MIVLNGGTGDDYFGWGRATTNSNRCSGDDRSLNGGKGRRRPPNRRNGDDVLSGVRRAMTVLSGGSRADDRTFKAAEGRK